MESRIDNTNVMRFETFETRKFHSEVFFSLVVTISNNAISITIEYNDESIIDISNNILPAIDILYIGNKEKLESSDLYETIGNIE